MMATVPYLAYLPAGLTAYSDPLNRRDWGKTTAGVVTVGGLWLGYSKIADPVWPGNNKAYWVKGTLAEYVPDEPDPDPDPTVPPPQTVTFKWLDASGNVVMTRDYAIKQ